MSITEKTATSVQTFIEIVSELEEKWDLWFRGHANAEWELVPRLYRELEAGSNTCG